MTQPALSFGLRSRGRHYPFPPCDPSDFPLNRWKSVNPDDIPEGVQALPSVTNILDLMDKPALRGWYAEHAIRGLYGSGSLPLDCDEAVSRFRWAANKVRDDRAAEGTDAHDLMERYATERRPSMDVPDELMGYYEAGIGFFADYDPDPIYVEATVADPDIGYAGTGDLFAHIDSDLAVLDYKTRAGEPDDKKTKRFGLLYESNRLQLAALAHAPYRLYHDGDGWTHEAMPTVTAGYGVVLYESGDYRVEQMDRDELASAFGAFCGLVTAWNWKQGAAA